MVAGSRSLWNTPRSLPGCEKGGPRHVVGDQPLFPFRRSGGAANHSHPTPMARPGPPRLAQLIPKPRIFTSRSIAQEFDLPARERRQVARKLGRASLPAVSDGSGTNFFVGPRLADRGSPRASPSPPDVDLAAPHPPHRTSGANSRSTSTPVQFATGRPIGNVGRPFLQSADREGRSEHGGSLWGRSPLDQLAPRSSRGPSLFTGGRKSDLFSAAGHTIFFREGALEVSSRYRHLVEERRGQPGAETAARPRWAPSSRARGSGGWLWRASPPPAGVATEIS